MSTYLFSAPVGATLEGVATYTGSATAHNAVELTVDMATTIVNDNGSTRQIKASEVVFILNLFSQYILKMDGGDFSGWPPVSS